MRVLIVKTTSLGDIIHTLPALTDAKRALPEVSFDWVVEEPFKEIPTWHPAVARVIPVALRRWRKNPWQAFKKLEIQHFLNDLRHDQYDVVIDAQGLLKSATLCLLTRGKVRIGLSWTSARESLASLIYRKKAQVPWEQHAVHRARALFAQGLGYSLPQDEAHYGISNSLLSKMPASQPYLVFLHGTTWATKHWPEPYWEELAQEVVKAGYQVQLLWGNEQELARAQRIAKSADNIQVADKKMSLKEVAVVLANAAGIVSMDTGLGHLAAALEVPTVALYGPTDPKLSGTLGKHQISMAANFACAPCFSKECTYAQKSIHAVTPPCFTSLTPAKVWATFSQHLQVARS